MTPENIVESSKAKRTKEVQKELSIVTFQNPSKQSSQIVYLFIYFQYTQFKHKIKIILLTCVDLPDPVSPTITRVSLFSNSSISCCLADAIGNRFLSTANLRLISANLLGSVSTIDGRVRRTKKKHFYKKCF